MTRRNLRKWAEAKRRRAEQRAPVRGHWSYSEDGIGIFFEESWMSSCGRATVWLPMCDEPPTPYLSRAWRDRVWADVPAEQKDPDGRWPSNE